jgi:hypothetical protein
VVRFGGGVGLSVGGVVAGGRGVGVVVGLFGVSGMVVVSVVTGASGGVVVVGRGVVLVFGAGVVLWPPSAEVADGLTLGRASTVAAVLPVRSVPVPGF